LLVFDTNDRFDDMCEKTVGASTSWTRFTCSFSSGSFTDVTLRLSVVDAPVIEDAFKGDAYYDNVVLRKQGSAKNLAVNGDFENSTTGWILPNEYFSLVGENLPPDE